MWNHRIAVSVRAELLAFSLGLIIIAACGRDQIAKLEVPTPAVQKEMTDTDRVAEIFKMVEDLDRLRRDATTPNFRMITSESGAWIEYDSRVAENPELRWDAGVTLLFRDLDSRNSRKIFAAEEMNTSESGDWIEYAFYYFRDDGSLAHLLCDYRTFVGDIKLETRIYFAQDGRELKREEILFDLMSNEILPPGTRDFPEMLPEIFANSEQFMARFPRELVEPDR